MTVRGGGHLRLIGSKLKHSISNQFVAESFGHVPAPEFTDCGHSLAAATLLCNPGRTPLNLYFTSPSLLAPIIKLPESLAKRSRYVTMCMHYLYIHIHIFFYICIYI